ncbi:MAG: BufA2 family periplasmic bufferin-type metallophore [Ostreibacterium sp.]
MTKTKMRMALVAATLLSTAMVATTAQADESEKGQCHGINTCKGQSACATADGACAGTNSCKGKGWLPKNKSDCDAAGGEFKAFKKK